MKITEEHFYHGAALNQIAEHPQFTAINSLKVKGVVSRSAFKINDTIAVYLKYASKPIGRFKENVFTFNKEHLSELQSIYDNGDKILLGLICVKEREICCLDYDKFLALIKRRLNASGGPEDQYALLVTLKPKEAFRVNMNAPGTKGKYLSKPIKVARKNFPNSLFE
jgi:hypothetical protein